MPTTRKREIPPHLIEAVREADQITAALRASGRPYAAFIFRRDIGRFITERVTEARFRFLTQRFDPGPGWPERKPQRRRPLPVTGKAPRQEWRPNVLPTGHDIADEQSGAEFAAVLLARYGVLA